MNAVSKIQLNKSTILNVKKYGLLSLSLLMTTVLTAKMSPNLFLSISAAQSSQSPTLFYGPFDSWTNVKTVYGAKGDGVTDDTAALQRALNDLGKTTQGKASVLYLPAGTYRITNRLRLYQVRNVAIIGESPDTVTLRWDGAGRGTMLLFENVAYSRLSRITFDGAGKRGTGFWMRWRGGDHFPTTFEISDTVFKDLRNGIQGGEDHNVAGHQDTAAEVSILRSQFFRNSNAGVYLRDWNTVEWRIRDSLFEDNGAGIFKDMGAFSVHNSVFRRSVNADIYEQQSSFISMRNNYSIGSKYFYYAAGPTGDGTTTTLQNNVILDPTIGAVGSYKAGPLTLLDNVIRNRAGSTQPPVVMEAFSPGNLISIGNTYTVDNPIRANRNNNRVYIQDDRVVDRNTVNPSAPQLPSTLPRSTAPVIQVTQNTGEAIQAAINQATSNYAGQRPVVHLPARDYSVTTPITIPANSDVRLVGDMGYLCYTGCTRLTWKSSNPGPVLRIQGSSRSQIQDIMIHGNNVANGVAVENADRQGGHIFLNQTMVDPFNTRGTGLIVNGLDNTVVDAINHQIISNSRGISVLGGPATASGQATTARVNLVGGGSGAIGQGPSFHVDQGARLMVQDAWYESGSRRTPILRLTGSGTVTLNSMYQQFFNGAAGTSPTISVDNFSGRLTMGGINFFASSVNIQGNNPNTNVLLFGSGLYRQNNVASNFTNNSSGGRVATLNNNTSNSPGTTQHVPNTDNIDSNWLNSMLSQLRQDTIKAPTANSLIMQRVGVEAANDAFIIQR
jgi:hypothetical protein